MVLPSLKHFFPLKKLASKCGDNEHDYEFGNYYKLVPPKMDPKKCFKAEESL